MDSMLRQNIKQLSEKYADQFIAIRQHLHTHPELSYKEFETSKFIQQKLKEWGIEYSIMATTGVVGIIKGKNPSSKIIALRGDMDALPITEENDIAYCSQNKGVMHACGHDVHTTCLLGAAKILSELKEEWEGTIKLIFQPGEEKNPGGASLMIEDGVLKSPQPNAIFGLHVHPSLEVGDFSFRSGKSMASADEIYITVKGKGGHAAAPHLTSDTVLAASQLVVNFQQMVSRMNDPLNPTVLSITSINGGNTTNVIPAEVKLMGTFRAMDETWRYKAHEIIKSICEHTAGITRTEIICNVDIGYPFLLNDESLCNKAIVLAKEMAGSDHVHETEIRMGAEDFAFYSHLIPACFFRLGVGNKERGISAGVHTSRFNIDERAISLGAQMMAWLGAGITV